MTMDIKKRILPGHNIKLLSYFITVALCALDILPMYKLILENFNEEKGCTSAQCLSLSLE